VLYQSPTTRIVRFGVAPAADGVLLKEYLGTQAAQRLRNEKDMLKRLAGVKGVVQLAEGAHGADILALRECNVRTLAQMPRSSRCDTATVLALAQQLARILADVHNAGVIHRDINPTNIIVSADGQPTLVDFDLAVIAAHHAAALPHAQIAGSLGYIAPEQTGRTGRAVDQRADLYSLGAVLYDITVGRPPFEQADALQLIHDHLVREPEAPWQVDATVPRVLSDIIVRLLAKAPEQRYQSAHGLLHDLQRLRSEHDRGTQDVFELGERDFAAGLAAPAQLVGRDAELAMLMNTFSDAVNTPRRSVLIGGPAGVGKSALINELRPAVAAAGGWFVYGKFDQYQRDASTASALTQAIRGLGRLLLTQSGDEVAAQRQRILYSLGRNAGLITRMSPEFALLLGKQAELRELDPRQAALQLQQAMLDLFVAIATPACPLVVVVDDLQWADAYSLRIFERMMMDLELPGFLLVGSYRSEEVTAGHLLTPMLTRWQQHAQPPSQIAVPNLTLAGVGEMIRQMLRLAPERALELAEALNVLTGGNPFDTVEMINALRADGVLSLKEAGWHWNEVKVRHFVGRGNVVDLLAARISRLPAASRELLEFMSCLGSVVECRLLCAALGLSDEELRARLRAPLEDGLLVPDQSSGQDSVGFRHDRVQQAMQGAMDDSQRGVRQLAMARRLAADPAFESDAAQQYLACASMLDERDEQRRAAHLFYRLAQDLASTATFALAERYLACAGQLLESIDALEDAALRRAIDVARHRALYSLGQVDDADPLYERIQASAQDPLDLVEPTCLHIRFLDIQGRTSEGVELAVRLLEQLGVHVPPGFSFPNRDERLDGLEEWVRQERRLDHSKRAQTQDPRLLGVYKALARLATSAFHCKNMNAVTWSVLQAQAMWSEHGPCDDLMAAIGGMGSLLISQRQSYRAAYNVSRHVIAVAESLGFEVRAAGMRMTFCWGPCVWIEPVERTLDDVTRAAEIFRTRGDDASFSSYFNNVRSAYLVEIADLETCEAEIETGLLRSRRTGNFHSAALHALEQQFVRSLRGKTKAHDSFDDEQFNEQVFMSKVGTLPRIQQTHARYRGFQSMIWGDVAELARYALFPGRSMSERVDFMLYRTMFAYLFAALARAWQLQRGNSSAADAAVLMAELQECRVWLEGRAADQPYNFLHLSLLVQAEQAWALGDMWKAATTFDAAVVEANARQRPWHKALITERAGLFGLAHGLAGAGRYMLAKARDHYQSWGAIAKADQMQREHVFLQGPVHNPGTQAGSHHGVSVKGSASVSPDALDLVGLLRASQALSSETSLEKLTARVSEVVASLSGATKVLVLSCNEGQWWLLPHAPSPSMPVARAAELGLLPLSAFAYAERTGEALIVDDAAGDDRFVRDPYFTDVPVCSLLLAPIASQGTTRGMLVLENRLGKTAFNAQRLDAVMLIAGQLAVSLANAQLYESLEQRVQARTRELQETQAQLVTTARRAGMAEVANNVLHNVGNVLNSINVSARVMRGNIGNSRIEGLARAVALLNEHEHDLPHFIETDPRGKALWPYLNRLVDALQSERDEILGDLDRLSLSVDHVTYVVATQQSHAGPSSVVEMARPQDLIEEALYLSAGTITRCNIAIVRHYENVPASALDKQRLVQVLVNLIGNAAQAMESMPADARELTLGSSLVHGENGPSLRVTVQDAGEGIAPENMSRIFSHGFTTRTSGHGFGLHSSAVAATEMGGKLTVHSDGPGRGAVFSIDLPLKI
jgi:predicted ATPase/signal transduction histidine kinase